MKLVHRDFEKDGNGTVVLIPDEAEDMWHAYNLIAEGDSVRASTIRKVGLEFLLYDGKHLGWKLFLYANIKWNFLYA